MNKPTLAITIGDPAGIGPEITVKALNHQEIREKAFYKVYGSLCLLQEACTLCHIPLSLLESPHIQIVDVPALSPGDFVKGKVNGDCGKAAYNYIEAAVKDTLIGKADAVVTAPINKESLKAGKVNFIGHTEIFGALTHTPDPLTLFEVKGLRVFFLSRHVSLQQACHLVTKERIIDYVQACTKALQQLGITEGTMAVAGLNPHSGEHGLFGTEEVQAIAPAVEELQQQGYAVVGPVSADSVFHLALQGRFNSVLSLYHDQGHIATKTYDFEKTISITCGMPILRTSVDHGTAFDIAGKNLASEISMMEAISVAAKYAPCWTKAL